MKIHAMNEIARIPSCEDQIKARVEGQRVAERHGGVNECPYTFDKVKMSQERFDAEVRPLFNAWFTGWSDQLKREGLGYNMKPVRGRRR